MTRAVSIAEPRACFASTWTARRAPLDAQPKLGRVRGEDALQFSQRRSRSDGRFDGIVTLGIDPGYFTNFYKQSCAASRGCRCRWFATTACSLAHWPLPKRSRSDARTLGHPARNDARDSLPVELALERTRLDTVRPLPGYPLQIAAALARSAVLAQWYRNLLVLAVFTFPTALALVLVSAVAMRRARREQEAVELLRAESDRRLHVEDSLRQSQKLEAIGRMTGGVAHDVNNLLMVIDSNLHLISKLEPAVAQSPHLAAIARTAKTGERLMRQLLAFSRRQALNPEVIRLQDKLDSLVALIRTTLGGKIRIDAHVDADTAAIEVDTAELELAMLNLAVNARDAMPGQGVLTIRGRNLPAGEMPDLAGRFVELVGIGHRPGHRTRRICQYVLEPFFTTKGAGKGTGLGLEPGLRPVRAGRRHRARRKRARQGHPDPPDLRGVRQGPAKADDVPAADGRRLSCRVLLVEDHHEVAEATKQLLESLGCTRAPCGHRRSGQAILAADRRAFDVLLSDIAMPGKVSGIDLARSAREFHRNMAVVLMTGYTAELRRANELSYTVLQKPVSPQTLAATITRARRSANQVAPLG